MRRVVDVANLPTFAFGSRSILWWGTLGIMAIEGTVFVLAIATYFYLQGNFEQWPPADSPVPGLWIATANTVVLLASLFPNQKVISAAEKLDLGNTRFWLIVADGFAVTFLVIRGFEFATLQIWWNSNAYGSILWTLLGLHTAHLLTDAVDSVVLTVLLFAKPVGGKRFVDVSENGFYWYFVVGAWLPIYFVIYLLPRISR